MKLAYQAVSLILGATVLYAAFLPAYAAEGDLVWRQNARVGTTYFEAAQSVIKAGNTLHIVGQFYDSGRSKTIWRYETRDASTGALLSSYVPSTTELNYSIAYVYMVMDASNFYVIYQHGSGGSTSIEKRSISSPGTRAWIRTINLGSNGSGFTSAAMTAAGFYAVIDNSYNISNGRADIDLLKISTSTGSTVWTQAFGTTYAASGMTADESGIYIQLQKPNNTNVEIKKITHSNTVAWTQIEPVTGKTVYEQFIIVDPSSGDLFNAYHSWNSSSDDFYVQRRSKSAGNIIWSHAINTGGTNDRSCGRYNLPYFYSGRMFMVEKCQIPGQSDAWFLQERNPNSNAAIIWEKVLIQPTNNANQFVGMSVDASGVYLSGVVLNMWDVEKRDINPAVPSEIDLGLRIFDGTATVPIAAEPAGTLTSPLRIAKNGTVYGILLVDVSDAKATKWRVRTASGIKAVKKYAP